MKTIVLLVSWFWFSAPPVPDNLERGVTQIEKDRLDTLEKWEEWGL